MAEPDTPPKNSEDRIETWPRPPRRRPTSEEASAIRRSEMPPRSMISPAKMNSGMAISEAEPLPAETCWASTTVGRSRYSSTASEAPARAKATGTPISSSRANTPNSRAMAMSQCPPSDAARGARASARRCSANSTVSAPPAASGR